MILDQSTIDYHQQLWDAKNQRPKDNSITMNINIDGSKSAKEFIEIVTKEIEKRVTK
jgi:hypothetical protein